MKSLILAFAFSAVAVSATASDDTVMFNVRVTQNGEQIAAPSFLAKVGEPATIRMGQGLLSFAIEALAKPPESDGLAWTKIRITTFETEDARMVQEMEMRTRPGDRNGSFGYNGPQKRYYYVEMRQ